jgi:hypothetical protein
LAADPMLGIPYLRPHEALRGSRYTRDQRRKRPHLRTASPRITIRFRETPSRQTDPLDRRCDRAPHP